MQRRRAFCTRRSRTDATNRSAQRISSTNASSWLRSLAQTHTHTHTRLTALCPQLPRWASTRKEKPIGQKGKTNWYFTEARDSEWQRHQLGRMQVGTLLQTDNHASTPPLSFLQATCPSCRPTNSIKALKALLTTTAFTKPVFSLSLTAIRATHTLTAGAR